MKLAMIASCMYDLDRTPYFRLNLESLRTYCKKWDITFILLDKKSHLTKNVANTIDSLYNFSNEPPKKIIPHIAKVLRLNELTLSNADYGIFVDLDTNIINLHSDIRDWIEDGKQYFSVCYPLKNTTHGRENQKINFSKFLLGKTVDKHTYKYLNTGFSILSKDFCAEYLQYATHYDINIEHLRDINNLFRYKNSIEVDDEFLIESFLIFCQANKKDFDIVSLKRLGVPNNIILDSYAWDKVTLEKIIQYYPIFFHNGNIQDFINRKEYGRPEALTHIANDPSNKDKCSYYIYNKLRHTRFAEIFEKRSP
tara:strand:- start:2056 stop:2985 length:930 start_codon:yes stop_codon:yes gene_type:complete